MDGCGKMGWRGKEGIRSGRGKARQPKDSSTARPVPALSRSRWACLRLLCTEPATFFFRLFRLPPFSTYHAQSSNSREETILHHTNTTYGIQYYPFEYGPALGLVYHDRGEFGLLRFVYKCRYIPQKTWYAIFKELVIISWQLDKRQRR